MSVVVHGDDFTALGVDEDLNWYEKSLAKYFELKIRGRIGVGCDGPNEIKILNRCLKLTAEGLVYEADPRHVDLLSDAFNLSKASGVQTPGVKDPDVDVSPKNDESECQPLSGARRDACAGIAARHGVHQTVESATPHQTGRLPRCGSGDDWRWG